MVLDDLNFRFQFILSNKINYDSSKGGCRGGLELKTVKTKLFIFFECNLFKSTFEQECFETVSSSFVCLGQPYLEDAVLGSWGLTY